MIQRNVGPQFWLQQSQSGKKYFWNSILVQVQFQPKFNSSDIHTAFLFNLLKHGYEFLFESFLHDLLAAMFCRSTVILLGIDGTLGN